MTSVPSLTVFRQRSVAATLTLMVFELVFFSDGGASGICDI